MGIDRQTEIMEQSRSIFGAVTAIDIAEDKVIDGRVFSIAKRHTLTSASTNDIVIDTTACNCDYLIVQPVVFKAFDAGPINIDMYFGTESGDDGTLWESINRDHKSGETSDVVVRLNPTVTSAGIKTASEFVIFSNGKAAVSKAGGETREGLIFNARTDGKYMFRVVNTANSSAFFHLSMTWYEVTI